MKMKDKMFLAGASGYLFIGFSALYLLRNNLQVSFWVNVGWIWFVVVGAVLPVVLEVEG